MMHTMNSFAGNRFFLWMFSLWLFLLLAMTPGCHKSGGDEEEGDVAISSTEVQVVKVEQGPIRQVLQVTGTLDALPNREVKISAMVPGRIVALLAMEGDSVGQGQLIARLDDSTLTQDLNQAKATLTDARQNEERQQKLFDRGIAAGKEKEDAERDYATAKADYDTKQIQLSRTQIHTPIAGMVTKRFVNVGEQVDGTADQPIVEVADFDPIILTASVPPAFLGSLKTGDTVEIKVDAYAEIPFSGTVDSILPELNAETNTATAKIKILNPGWKLKGGMFATGGIITGVHESALFVPAAAVVTRNDAPKVYVVGPDSKAQERDVKLGWRDGDKVEILDGVHAGETVVTTGSYGLADQMKVTIQK